MVVIAVRERTDAPRGPQVYEGLRESGLLAVSVLAQALEALMVVKFHTWRLRELAPGYMLHPKFLSMVEITDNKTGWACWRMDRCLAVIEALNRRRKRWERAARMQRQFQF
jgi:hypothetical protein